MGDIESDLSAFHRVDDWRTLDAPRFFLLAIRLGAYQGALAGRIAAEQRDEDERSGVAPGSAEKVSHVSDETALAMLANEGWVERG